jgi:hypothetical protein
MSDTDDSSGEEETCTFLVVRTSDAERKEVNATPLTTKNPAIL